MSVGVIYVCNLRLSEVFPGNMHKKLNGERGVGILVNKITYFLLLGPVMSF